MALIDEIKAAVRIVDGDTATPAQIARTNDLQGYVNACKDDLKRAGVDEEKIVDTDVRVIQACKLYVMAMIDYQGKGTVYMDRYNRYMTGIVLDPEYREAESDV